MKVSLRRYMLFFLVFALFFLSGCKGKITEEPHIKVVADNQEIH